MNDLTAAICLSVIAALLTLAAGCGESRAPAMTQGSQAMPTGRLATDDSRAASSAAAVRAREPAEEKTDGRPAAVRDQSQADVTASPPERTRDISFDDLKFDINTGDPFKRSLLNDKIEALDGKPVRIRGYILPSFQQTGLTQFVLVRDNLSCCFGPGAAIYDCVIVEMKPGKSTDYSLYPVAVEGSFSIREMLDPDDKAVAIYHLDGEQVR